MAQRILRQLRSDRGLTVVEMSIATALSMIVMFGVLSVLDSGTRNERGQQARHDALLELRGAGDRITKDLRQATEIHSSSNSNRLSIKTIVSGVDKGVVYTVNLAGAVVTRAECDLDDYTTVGNCDGAVAQPVITEARAAGSPAAPVFCYLWDSDPMDPHCADGGSLPSPLTAIRVTVARAPELSGMPVMVATDIDLRNI